MRVVFSEAVHRGSKEILVDQEAIESTILAVLEKLMAKDIFGHKLILPWDTVVSVSRSRGATYIPGGEDIWHCEVSVEVDLSHPNLPGGTKKIGCFLGMVSLFKALSQKRNERMRVERAIQRKLRRLEPVFDEIEDWIVRAYFQGPIPLSNEVRAHFAKKAKTRGVQIRIS